MALHLRQRGAIWYARGTIRVGRQTIDVPEFSTGCSARADAEEVAGHEAARIREDILAGPAGRAKRLTVADCILGYLRRPKGVSRLDTAKFDALNEMIGAFTLDNLAGAWRLWLEKHPKHAPATALRYRALILSAVRATCEAHSVPAPTLPEVATDHDERVALLTAQERAALIRSYSPHAACPALVLARQGARTQEVLRLDWRDVDFPLDTIRFGVRRDGAFRQGRRNKNRRGRAVPIDRQVRMLLWGMWHAAGRPSEGPVFLSSRGEPYADTTDEGGNPLRKAHETACRRARITGFRVHDWRHDWAGRQVMGGVDLYTLMRLGGWASLKMVERYAAVSAEHLREAVRKVA